MVTAPWAFYDFPAEHWVHPLEGRDVVDRIVRWYNEERLHGALGYLRPVDYHCGDAVKLQEVRRAKLAQARHA